MPASDVIRDLVVVLPGIMGSTLARNGKPVWSPSAGSVLTAIRTFGDSIRELTLPDDIGDGRPDKEGVEPVALMPDLHVLPGIWTANIGYGKLLDWLRTRFHFIERSPDDPSRIPNLLPVAYDWRLSNRYNGRRLKAIVDPALDQWRSQGEPFSDAKIIFICHSMGGLVARWYIEKEGGAELTRKLVTLGTPYRGALNALDQLVNGVRKGIGPIQFDLTNFARSLPSLYQLLPEYACIESPDGLIKTTGRILPKLKKAMVENALKLHDDLDQAAAANTAHPYDVHPIVGFRQQTYTTAALTDIAVEGIETIEGNDESGDGTVPRIAAVPKSLRLDHPSIHYIPDQHGSLQSNQAALDQLEGILIGRPTVYRAAGRIELGVRVEPVILAGERMTIEAKVAGAVRVRLLAKIYNEQGREVQTGSFKPDGDAQRTSIEMPVPGAYRVVVGGVDATSVAPVTSTVLVWGN